MELNPNTPRQRNRRADRSAAPEQPLQTPVVQRVQTDYQQTIQPAQMSTPVQPVVPSQAVPQTPQTMYQTPAQPVRPTSYPHSSQINVQNGYLQRPQAPVQQVQTPLQPAQTNSRPKSLPQSRQVNSGWQQPTVPAAEVPRAQTTGLERAAARTAINPLLEEYPEEKQTKKKLPGWLTTAVSLSVILVLALAAAYWLMQAYLVTQENARIAAYKAVLDNYHVTEDADGVLRVTWQDEIEYYAAQYNLQPAFVTAIIRTESSFRANAESSVGARGLMQMMPDTAEWIAGKLDDDSYTFDSMWDAETNIRYGCWYLGYLSRLFRGDAELVSAAYHAGQTTITQWLSDPKKSSDGLTLDLEKLTDGPTKQYIGRVTQAYGIYQTLLYPDAAFGGAAAVPADGGGAAAADR